MAPWSAQTLLYTNDFFETASCRNGSKSAIRSAKFERQLLGRLLLRTTPREAIGLVDVVKKKSRRRTVLEISSAEPQKIWTLDAFCRLHHWAQSPTSSIGFVEIGKDGTITKLRTIYEPAIERSRTTRSSTTFLGK